MSVKLEPYEPKVMHHPNSRKAKIKPVVGVDAAGRQVTDYQGEPDTLPDVTVKDPTTEAYYRARGYLFVGEVPPPPVEYKEYPVMLIHPDHVDAVPDDWTVEKGEHGEVIRHRIPGTPEKFPPRQANDEAEEAAWNAKGYVRGGQDNPDAIRTAKASPYVPNRVHKEYPKIVDGVVVDPDADDGGPIQYPKWVKPPGAKDAVIVNSLEEEINITGVVPELPAEGEETCVICGEVINEGDEGVGKGKKGLYHLTH